MRQALSSSQSRPPWRFLAAACAALVVLVLGVVLVVLVHEDNTSSILLLSTTIEQQQQQQQQQPQPGLMAVEEDALARYKAAPPGFRRAPSYYADTYTRRAAAPDPAYGSWTLVDERRHTRPDDAFYDQYPHRDVPWNDFPASTAWQTDASYLPQFLDQGIALTERAMEAILMEYGFGPERDPRPLVERMERLNSKGALYKNSYPHLVRRVLHAIVTQDTFVFAMSGHSAAAGEYICYVSF